MPDMQHVPHGAHHIAADVHGQNFYAIDRQFQDLMSLYMEPGLRAAMTPHFQHLGQLAGNRLDELAMIADKHPPVLNARDRFGRTALHDAARRLEATDGEAGRARAVADYIAGMTDRFAISEHSRLYDPAV